MTPQNFQIQHQNGFSRRNRLEKASQRPQEPVHAFQQKNAQHARRRRVVPKTAKSLPQNRGNEGSFSGQEQGNGEPVQGTAGASGQQLRLLEPDQEQHREHQVFVSEGHHGFGEGDRGESGGDRQADRGAEDEHREAAIQTQRGETQASNVPRSADRGVNLSAEHRTREV